MFRSRLMRMPGPLHQGQYLYSLMGKKNGRTLASPPVLKPESVVTQQPASKLCLSASHADGYACGWILSKEKRRNFFRRVSPFPGAACAAGSNYGTTTTVGAGGVDGTDVKLVEAEKLPSPAKLFARTAKA